MAQYLLQVAYTPEGWSAQLNNPQDRVKIVNELLGKLGGRFLSAYYAFGEYDIVAVMEMPDNVGAAAVSIAVAAGGACKAVKTTPLMGVEEGIQAIRKAGEARSSYRPPGSA